MVQLRNKDFPRITCQFFVVPHVVLVGRLHGDFVSRVVAGELVGCPCLSANRLAVALPLVGDARIRHAVGIANDCGQRLSDFGLAANSDFARVVGLRLRLGI